MDWQKSKRRNAFTSSLNDAIEIINEDADYLFGAVIINKFLSFPANKK